jgi:DNA-binding helix-hairpin-helix protein with protein kinase domain
VRGIPGFGDVLTGHVVAWRQEVERQFRFDPNSGLPPADQRTLAVRFRTQQSQLFLELDKLLAELETLEKSCGTELEPQLRRAVAEWELAEADLRAITSRP